MSVAEKACRKAVAEPVVGGLHHIYKAAEYSLYAPHSLSVTVAMKAVSLAMKETMNRPTETRVRGTTDAR